jgi:cell wall-associated NlpC family hydrolase
MHERMCAAMVRLVTALVALFALAGAGTAGTGTVAGQPAGALWADGDSAAFGSEVDALLPNGYGNPRTAEQAVAWALSQVGVHRDAGYCLRFVDLAYGRSSGPPSAYMVWTGSPAGLHHTSGMPPRGALVVWSSAIGRGHGHIAISLGDGRMVSTTSGAVAILPIRGFSDSAYYGWMPPYFYI